MTARLATEVLAGMHKHRSAAVAALFVVGSALLALVGQVAPAAAAGPTVVYDSIPAPLAPNYPSQPFQAQATREFGDDVWLGSGGRTLQSVTIGVSTWARQADVPSYTDPSAWTDPTGWSHPFTVKVYAVSGPVSAPVVGALLAQTTETKHIPWRHPDTTGCGAGRWSPVSDSATSPCYSGQALELTFDLSSPAVTLPPRVAVTLSFDTQTYGASPIGANGPYNSFNVALPPTAPTKGLDSSADTVLWDSTYAGRLAGLRFDSGWTGYVPAIRVTTSGATESTTVVTRTASQGWTFVDDTLGGGQLGRYVAGPATPPLGHGSARLAVSSAAQGQALIRVPSNGGVRLDSINELTYRTYRSSVDAGNNLAISLQFALDFDLTDANNGFQGRLVYEPYLTDGGHVVQGVWQAWDALAGKWWVTRPTSVAPAATCVQATPCTLAQFLAAYPNAGIHKDLLSGLMLKAGSGWASFTGNADALRVGINGATTQYDFEDTPCTTDCYVSTLGNDLNGGTSYLDAKRTIQAAIDAVQAGGTVHVFDGTYAESPNVTKSLTLTSEHGAAATTIDLQTGPTYLGSLTVAGQDVTVHGFTVEGFDGSASTLAASNITVLPNLHDIAITDNVIKVGRIGSASNGDDGIGVLTYWDTVHDTHSLSVTGNRFRPLNGTGTRAFFINPGTDAFLFQGNVIDGAFDATAVTQAKHGTVRGNTVTGTGSSATLGTWGYPDPTVYGRTEFDANTVSGTTAGFRIVGTNNVTIHHNVVHDVVDGVAVVDRPSDGLTGQLAGDTVVIRDNSFTSFSGKRVTNSYPSAVDASANWWGTTAVAPGDVTGAVDYTPVLTTGTDTSGSAGFQGSVTELKVHTLGAQLGTEGRIQEGIDSTVADGFVDVAPGDYSETATGRTTPQVGPTYQFGLYVGTDRHGVTIRGVDAADAPITSSGATLARITTNATNDFGYSGTFVYGSDVTFRGLEFGTNSPSSNKTFEVIGDGFSLLDSYVNDTFGSVYLNDWTYDTQDDRSSIATFTIHGDRFATDNQITIASGTGYGHPAAGRLITDNTFDSAPTSLYISFRGKAGVGGVPWYALPVGGAVITGNTFGPADIAIRATDQYDESQMDWATWRSANTFTRLVWVEAGNSGDLRSFAYSSSGYAFTNARQLGGRIDERAMPNRPAGVQIAQAGDTVWAHTGTYPEQAIVDKADITVRGEGVVKPLVDDGGSATGNGLLVTGDGVTLRDLKVQGYEVGVRLSGGGDSLLDGVSVLDVESVDNASDGLFASAIAGLSDLTINGGVYSHNLNTGATPGGRGIVVWDGPKSGISITDVTANGNSLVGIDINDGNVTGLTITGNTVVGNADSGIGVLGAKGPAANLVAGNTVTDNGRYGIEIKDPDGNGAASGPGSVVIAGNHVSRAPGATPAGKDFAGIAVFRRSVSSLNTDQPSGAYVVGNDITGYRYTGTGHDGFGIVVEGTDQTVTQNAITNNDVGVQVQSGNPDGLPGDATPGGSPAAYFDRGNAASYSGTVFGNSIVGNTQAFRAVGISGAADASGNWWGTTDETVIAGLLSGTVDFTPFLHTGSDTDGAAGFQGDFHSLDVVRIGAQVGSSPRIQEAIDMVSGSTVYVHAGDYVEDVVADVTDLQLLGAHHGDPVGPRTFGDPTEATIHGQLTIQAAGVLVDGFSLTHTTTSDSVIGILVKTAGDGADIRHDLIDGVSTSHASGLAQAIYLEHGPDGVSITGNAISHVSSQRSAKGIYIGDTTASDPSAATSITDNTIAHISSDTRGAYGILTNNAAGATLGISGNDIHDLTGGWAHGIGIEGDAPDLAIDHNVIHDLTAAGPDKVAVFFEGDPSYADAEVHHNDLAVGASAFGAAHHPSLSVSTPIDAECNWWGDASGPGAVAAGTGSLVGPDVDFSPWLTTSDLDGACDAIAETVAPTDPLAFDEGTLATNGGTFVGTDITITSDATIGTFTDNGDGTWSWSLGAHDPDNDGPDSGTIGLTATTALGATASSRFHYTVANLAPSGTFVAPAEVAVGDAFDIGFDPTVDPSAGDTTFSYVFTCGAASPVTSAADSTTCAAPTSGQVGTSIHVTGTITDDDGGTSGLYEADVLVVPALTITPTSHAFGSVVVGESSAPETFTLTNHSDVDYDVDEVGFFVTATNHFRIVDGPTDHCSGQPLPGHTSCTFEVVFSPQATGSRSTTLGVQLDGAQAPLPKPGSALSGTGIAPHATISDTSFDYPDTTVGTTSPTTFTIGNDGTADLHISSIAISGSPRFSRTGGSCSLATPVPAGTDCTIEVTFEPTAAGDVDADLVVVTDGGTVGAHLTGTGLAVPVPHLSIDPSDDPFDFGDVEVGDTHSQTFAITNDGEPGSVLHVSSITIPFAGSGFNRVGGTLPIDLAVGDDPLEFDVQFAPDGPGSHHATMSITVTGLGVTTVHLKGRGLAPELTVTPSAYNFGDVTVDHSKSKVFTVANTGTSGLTGLVVDVTGDDLSIVADDSDCDETTDLDPGESCQVKVRYAPDEVGDDTGSLTATADGGLSDASSLEGSGVPGVPIVTVDPTDHAFADVVVGGTPETQDFTVTNTGEVALLGIDVQLTGSPAFDTLPTDDIDCESEAASLAPGDSCVIRVAFGPGTGGAKTGTLRILSTNAGNGTVNVPLSGMALAPELTVTPSAYNFGDVTVDHSKSKVFTVANTGTSGLTGLVVDVTGDDLSIVADDSDCDETTDLDPGESCQVKVRYAPDEVGDDTGSLTATADGGLSEASSLEGSGVQAKGVVEVTPDEYDFGPTEIGTATTTDLTVRNTGDATLSFTGIDITGVAAFSIVPTVDGDCLTEVASLAPDDTCVIGVRFAPGSVGDKAGAVRIMSNAANSMVKVPLEGTATPHPSAVSVNPNPYDFGPVVYEGIRTRLFTVTNHGGTPAKITNITRTGSSSFTVLPADDECAGETLGEDESCTFQVRFVAPSHTAGLKSAVIHVAGTGFSEILVPVTATAEPFKARVDAFITDKSDKPWHYIGRGVYCKASCPQQQVTETARHGTTVLYRVRIRNNGNGVDDIRVRLYQTASKSSVERIQVLRNGNQDVTSKVANGSYVANDVNPGAEIYFWVRVTLKSSAVPGRVNVVILSGQSSRTPRVKDYVRALTTVR